MKILVVFLVSLFSLFAFSEEPSEKSLQIEDETFIFDSSQKRQEFIQKFQTSNCLKENTSVANCECQSLLLKARLEAISLSKTKGSDAKTIERYNNLYKKYELWSDKARKVKGKRVAGVTCEDFTKYNSNQCDRSGNTKISKNPITSCACIANNIRSNLNYSLNKLNAYLKKLKIQNGSKLNLELILSGTTGLVDSCQGMVSSVSRVQPMECNPGGQQKTPKKKSKSGTPKVVTNEIIDQKLNQENKVLLGLTYKQAACSKDVNIQQKFRDFVFSKFSQTADHFKDSVLDNSFNALDTDQKWCLLDAETFAAYKPKRIKASAEAYLYACYRSRYAKATLCRSDEDIKQDVENHVKIQCIQSSSPSLIPPHDFHSSKIKQKFRVDVKDTSACNSLIAKCKEKLLPYESKQTFNQNLAAIKELDEFKIEDNYALDACKDSKLTLYAQMKQKAWDEAMSADVMGLTSALSAKAISHIMTLNPALKTIPSDLSEAVIDALLSGAMTYRWEMIQACQEGLDKSVGPNGKTKSKEAIRAGIKKVYEKAIDAVVEKVADKIVDKVCTSKKLKKFYGVKEPEGNACETAVKKLPFVKELNEFVRKGVNKFVTPKDFQLSLGK